MGGTSVLFLYVVALLRFRDGEQTLSPEPELPNLILEPQQRKQVGVGCQQYSEPRATR